MYAVEEKNRGAAVSTKVVMNLYINLLNVSRTVISDNYLTSLELANCLLNNRMHLIEALRANRIGNPIKVVGKKLKKGKMFAKENTRGVCVKKWHDKRDVIVLSTKHTDSLQTIGRYTKPIHELDAIIDNNAGKTAMDFSDQMSNYNFVSRRSLKGYRKIRTSAGYNYCEGLYDLL